MRNTFVTTLIEQAEGNPDIWLLNGDLGFSVLEPFAEKFPGRSLNMGVAEQNMVGNAAGLALSGKTVFLYSIGNFPTFRCLEQLRNDVCYHELDIKVVAVGAGFAYGTLGYTHHAVEDIAVTGVLPGMEIFAPADPVEVAAITAYISQSGKPSYMRLNKSGEPNVHKGAIEFEPGKALRLREGDDVSLLVCGGMAVEALAAADLLKQAGIAAGVVSMPSIEPFDKNFVRAEAERVSLLATIEEHVEQGGLFARTAQTLATQSSHAPVLPFFVSEEILLAQEGGAKRETMLARCGIDAVSIAQTVKNAL